MKRSKIARSEVELPEVKLLRTAPVLWSLNLHRLPKRLLRFLIVFAGVAVVLWFRSPRIHPLIVVGLGFLAAIFSVVAFVLEYAGVPSDELIPTPRAVHWQALWRRFLALVPVMVAPLLLGEIATHGVKNTSKIELVETINEINVGAFACCELSTSASACYHRQFIPRRPDEPWRILGHGLPLLAEIVAQSRAESCNKDTECLASLIATFDSAILKYQDLANRNRLGTNKDEKDMQTMAGGTTTTPLPLACRTVQHRHFADADTNIREILMISGVVGHGDRAVPFRFYIDVVLWAAWLALLAGTGTLSNAAPAVLATIMAPMIPLIAGSVLWLIAFLFFDVPVFQFDDLPGAGWLRSHGIALVQGYFALCGLAYVVAGWRLVRRPPDEGRGNSLGYFAGFPLVLLGLVALAEMLPRDHMLVVSSNSLRITSFVMLLVYLVLFEQLRRQGEKMRALPKAAPPETTTEET